MLRSVSIGPIKADVVSVNRNSFIRLRSSILRGIALFRYFHPAKNAHLVLDEASFLVPDPDDSVEVIASKRECFKRVLTLAIMLGHDFRSCQVVLSSSTPEICQMGVGNT